MACPLHQDIGYDFGLRRVFEFQSLCGHEHQEVMGVKNGTRFHVTGNGYIRYADAVHLYGQLDRYISKTQFAGYAYHGPAAHTVTNEDDLRAVPQFLKGEGAGVRGKMRKDPVEAGGRIVRQKGIGANIRVPWPAQGVADLYDARCFVTGGFHSAYETGVDNLAVWFISYLPRDSWRGGFRGAGRRSRRKGQAQELTRKDEQNQRTTRHPARQVRGRNENCMQGPGRRINEWSYRLELSLHAHGRV